MKEDGQATALLVRNAAVHAGQIKRELAAIIKASGRLQEALQTQLQVPYGMLPQDAGQLSEPSVPDLADVFGQEAHLAVQGEAGVTPGEQQAPPKADDGHPSDTPLLPTAAARGPVRLLASYPIHSAMQSDDDGGDLSSEGSLLQAATAKGGAGHGGHNKGMSILGGWPAAGLHHNLTDLRQVQSRPTLPAWKPGTQPHTHTQFHPAASASHAATSGFTPQNTVAWSTAPGTHRSFSPDMSGPFGQGFTRSLRAARTAPRAARKSPSSKPKTDLPPWDSSAGGKAGGQRGYKRQDSRSSLQHESLQELKERFIARVQQANNARHMNRSKRAQEGMAASQQRGRKQAQEQIPHTTLLKHSTSTSVPATPTRPRHTHVHPTDAPRQQPSAWQAARSLQNSPFRAGLLEAGPHAVAQGSGWPAASQLAWEGSGNHQAAQIADEASKASAAHRTLFADQNSSGHHNSLQQAFSQHPQPYSSNALSSRDIIASRVQNSISGLKPAHAGPVQQSRRLSESAEASAWGVSRQNDSRASSVIVAPLHTRISLDCLVPTVNSSQLESFSSESADVRDSANSSGLLLSSETKPGNAQVSRESREHFTARQSLQCSASLQVLQQQHARGGRNMAVGARVADQAHYMQRLSSQNDTAAHLQPDIAQQAQPANAKKAQHGMKRHALQNSKQAQGKATAQNTTEKGRAGVPQGGAGVAQQKLVEGPNTRAAARALRQSGSFASPTRSSAAKARGSGHSGHGYTTSAASNQASKKSLRHAADQSAAADVAAPLLSTFRLGDLLAVQNSASSHQPAAAPVQQKQQALLHQQHTEQQQEHTKQQQELATQQESTEQQQHDRLDVQQHQQQYEHDLPIIGTNEMAEALGRLCQAASKKQRLAHARRDGKASSSGSSSPAHASRRHSPESRTADATCSSRSTSQHGSRGRSQHSRPELVGSSRPSSESHIADATSSSHSTPQHGSHDKQQHSRQAVMGSSGSTSTGVSPDKLAQSSVSAATAVAPAVHMTSSAGNSRDNNSHSSTGPAHSSGPASPGAATIAPSEQLLRAFVEADTQARNAKSAAQEAHVAMPESQVAMPASELSSRQEPVYTAAADAGSAIDLSADAASAADSTAASGTVLLLPGAMQEAALSSVPIGHSSQHASPAAEMLQQLESAATMPQGTSPDTGASNAATEPGTSRQQSSHASEIAADAGDLEVAVSDDAGTAVPQEASSDSMQAQTPLPQEGSSDSMLALSPLSQSANSARPVSSHSAETAEDQETTSSGQEATALRQEASPAGQEAITPVREASASGQATTALQQEATAQGQEPMALPDSDSTIPSNIASEGSFDVLGVGGVTPPAQGVRSVLDSVQSLSGAEMQSPNKSKYARSENRQAGTRIADHPIGTQLLQEYPELASKQGSDLLAALRQGTEMRKAWEGGSGGSNRLLQCLVNQGEACIAYSHGWMRKPVQHAILRVHVPSDAWQNNQAMTVDTGRGAIDLEPPSGLEYAIWVLGLNAAMTNAVGGTLSTNVPVDQMLWSSELFVMSN